MNCVASGSEASREHPSISTITALIPKETTLEALLKLTRKLDRDFKEVTVVEHSSSMPSDFLLANKARSTASLLLELSIRDTNLLFYQWNSGEVVLAEIA